MVVLSHKDSRREKLIDQDGNGMCHGGKLENFWNTDLQLAIRKSNDHNHSSFLIRLGTVATSNPYQQVIPIKFARQHTSLYNTRITLEGPTGRTWITVIRPLPNKVRFGAGGWRQFAEDNRLQVGHQLLFTLAGKSYFLVEFFDHMCRRCTGYPLAPLNPPAQTQRHCRRTLPPESDPGQLVDGGQSSHSHDTAAQTAATDPTAASPLDSDLGKVFPHKRKQQLKVADPKPPSPSKLVKDRKKRKSDERIGLPTNEDLETLHQDPDAVEEADKYICLDSDAEDTPPAPKSPIPKQQPVTHNLNRNGLRTPAGFHSPAKKSRPRQMPDPFSLSGDEDLQEPPRKVTVNRPPPGPPDSSFGAAGISAEDTPAELLLKQQGCMRYSDLVRNSKRKHVNDLEKCAAAAAATNFASALNSTNFVVVLRAWQIYHRFILAIPDRIVRVTGAEHARKVNGWLMDGKNLISRIHWEQPEFGGEPRLDRDGWAKFAVDHWLEEGDVCVFELRPCECPAPLPSFLFKLHIFPVVQPPEGRLDFL